MSRFTVPDLKQLSAMLFTAPTAASEVFLYCTHFINSFFKSYVIKKILNLEKPDYWYCVVKEWRRGILSGIPQSPVHSLPVYTYQLGTTPASILHRKVLWAVPPCIFHLVHVRAYNHQISLPGRWLQKWASEKWRKNLNFLGLRGRCSPSSIVVELGQNQCNLHLPLHIPSNSCPWSLNRSTKNWSSTNFLVAVILLYIDTTLDNVRYYYCLIIIPYWVKFFPVIIIIIISEKNSIIVVCLFE